MHVSTAISTKIAAPTALGYPTSVQRALTLRHQPIRFYLRLLSGLTVCDATVIYITAATTAVECYKYYFFEMGKNTSVSASKRCMQHLFKFIEASIQSPYYKIIVNHGSLSVST
jgi:hypothetical protein